MTIDITAIVNSYSEQIVELREENEQLKARIKDLEHELKQTGWERDDYREVVWDLAHDGEWSQYQAKKVLAGWEDEEDEDEEEDETEQA